MVCDTVSQAELDRRERERLLKEREEQLQKLENELKNKSARIVKMGNRVSIEGWSERGGWCDACVVRKLRQSSDPFVRHLVETTVPTEQGITFGHGH